MTIAQNIRSAQKRWGNLSLAARRRLAELSKEHELSVSGGDLLLLDQNWYITHTGLLRVATRRGCTGIEIRAVEALCDPQRNAWVVQATAFRDKYCKGFSGIGDANPTNVSPIVRGAELRIAETRAVNRALRKAYGIGLCSIEEIGSNNPPEPSAAQGKRPAQPAVVKGNGHHLRDRLLVLIRQQKLDGALVKAYAADFCSVKELREASKEQVQEFIEPSL